MKTGDLIFVDNHLSRFYGKYGRVLRTLQDGRVVALHDGVPTTHAHGFHKAVVRNSTLSDSQMLQLWCSKWHANDRHLLRITRLASTPLYTLVPMAGYTNAIVNVFDGALLLGLWPVDRQANPFGVLRGVEIWRAYACALERLHSRGGSRYDHPGVAAALSARTLR